MFETLYFVLGVLNNLLLLAVFIARRKSVTRVAQVGKMYICITGPLAVCALVLGIRQQVDARYTVFLSIFAAYLCIEVLYDFVLKLHFRNNVILATPYVCLYYAMNYGFVVMVWKASVARGVLLLTLFAAQIIANAISHPRKSAST